MKQMIGTVCDNYKVDMFKAEFKSAGIEIVSILPFMPGFSIIKTFAEQSQVKPICDKVTQYFYDLAKQKKYN